MNKPRGWTSFDVVSFVRKRWKIKSAGHTGTLDPLAEGVMIIALGTATKLSRIFIGLPKSYVARIRFGVSTDTDDITGAVIEKRDTSLLTEEDVIRTSKDFSGTITQKPPRFSAVKIEGKTAYRMARKSEEFELKDREVTIHDFRIKNINFPDVEVGISCSSGTYIRSIARDWGRSLNVGAVLAELRRTSVGRFSLEDSYTIDQLGEFDSPPLMDFDFATSFIDKIPVDSEKASKVRDGVMLDDRFIKEAGGIKNRMKRFLLMEDNRFPVALVERKEENPDEYRYLRVIREWR